MYVLIYVLTKKFSNHIYNAHICIYIFIYVYIFVANVCTYRAKTRMKKTKRLIVVTYYFFYYECYYLFVISWNFV